MKKQFVLFSLLALIMCMPVFAQEYAAKRNPNFRAKAFSVSPKRKVYFTQGNLIAQYFDDGDYGFTTKQYDTFENKSSEYPNWKSIHSAPPADAVMTSDMIVNGKTQNPRKYRPLTKSEWQWILETRTNAAKLQSIATVCDVHGYILLPDAWVLPQDLTFTPCAESYTTNVYNAAQWIKMESAGAVFLPAEGNGGQYGGYTYSVGESGYYWTATENPFDSSNSYYFKFGEKKKDILDNGYCRDKYSLRLVYNVQ